MSTFNTIPAGYRLTFVSSENDGDNYKTVVKEGVSEAETALLAELAQVDSGLENNFEPSKKELEKGYKILWPIFEKHKDVFTAKKLAAFKDDIGEMTDYISENMLGYPAEEGYWMRVLQQYKIEYIPQEIQIEDVTAKFSLKK